MSEFGVHCVNPAILQERCFVSYGLDFLKTEEAEQRGYYASKLAEIIIPATLPAPASDIKELDPIIAGPDTKRLMQLCRVPRAIGERLLQGCRQSDFKTFKEDDPYQELAPGIVGAYTDFRVDDPGQLNVSINPQVINRYTKKPVKVGDHADRWANIDLSLLIGNMGPGERWHRIAPEVNASTTGGNNIQDRVQFLRTHPDRSAIPVYWFKLAAPTDDYIEVIFNSPVAWALHEGATLGSREPSTAFFCAIDPVRVGAYPSLMLAA